MMSRIIETVGSRTFTAIEQHQKQGHYQTNVNQMPLEEFSRLRRSEIEERLFAPGRVNALSGVPALEAQFWERSVILGEIKG
jgi:hypothetical protein